MKQPKPVSNVNSEKKPSAFSADNQQKCGTTDFQHGDPTRSEYLDFRAHRVYYEVRGSTGKTLVFLHGWSSSISSWKYQLNSFPGYTVIAIDMPGHGKSSKNEQTEYTMELLADSVHAVLEHEKIKKAFIFGHSMGFAVAEIIAQKYPGLCAGIGCIDGVHFEVPEDEQGKQGWLQFNRGFAESLNIEKGRDDFINSLLLPDTPQLLRDEIFSTSRMMPLSVGRALVANVEKDMAYWKKRVMSTPCLAIHSPVFQLTPEYFRDFRVMYPKAEILEIPGVSHFLMMEMPYKINQIIHDYLEKIEIGAGMSRGNPSGYCDHTLG